MTDHKLSSHARRVKAETLPVLLDELESAAIARRRRRLAAQVASVVSVLALVVIAALTLSPRAGVAPSRAPSPGPMASGSASPVETAPRPQLVTVRSTAELLGDEAPSVTRVTNSPAQLVRLTAQSSRVTRYSVHTGSAVQRVGRLSDEQLIVVAAEMGLSVGVVTVAGESRAIGWEPRGLDPAP